MMGADTIFCFPGDSLQVAAKLIRKAGGGPIPVLRDASSRVFVGVVKEGAWMGGAGRVREVMTMPAIVCRKGDDFRPVLGRMERERQWRAPVLHPDGSLAGMLVHPRVRKGPSSGGLLLSAAAFALGALVMFLAAPGKPAAGPPVPESKPIRRRGRAQRGELSLTATALGGGLAMYAMRGRGRMVKATAMLGMGMLARGLTHVKGEGS